MRTGSGITRRRFVWSAAAGGLIAAAATPLRSYAQTKRRLRYVSFAGKSSIWSQTYPELARQVAERSNGELQID
jgi:TRAP-type C4-dicarboxylate transport system substrate-binding protein